MGGGCFLQGSYGVFWFITVLWFSTNIFNLILYFRIGIWFLPVMISLGYVMALIPIPLPYNIQIVPMAIAFTWIGFLLRNLVVSIIISYDRNPNYRHLLLSVLILVVVYAYREELRLNMKFNDFGIYGISLITATVATCSVALISIWISRLGVIAKILSYIGEASMMVMYLHQPVKFILMVHYGLDNNHLVVILSGILIPLVAYWLFNRYSITRKLLLGKSPAHG